MVKVDDHWVETVLISIAKKSGSDVEFAARGSDVAFSGGEKDIAIRTLFNGGNMRRYTPMTLHEVSFKVYPDEVHDAKQLFYGTANAKGSGVTTTTNSLVRFDARIVLLWTDKAASAAAEVINGSNAGLRYVGINGNITKCEEFWDDGELGFDITIKIPPFNRSGTGNNTWTSTDGTGDMAAVGAYS